MIPKMHLTTLPQFLHFPTLDSHNFHKDYSSHFLRLYNYHSTLRRYVSFGGTDSSLSEICQVQNSRSFNLHLAKKFIPKDIYFLVQLSFSFIVCTIKNLQHQVHCVKRVQKRIFSGPYFSVFSPNIGKCGPEKTEYLDTFHAVVMKAKE